MRLKYIIVKSKCDAHSEHEENETSGKYEFWKDSDYHEYEEKNGNHFSDKLADYAIKAMQNNAHADTAHKWSVQDVKSAFEKLGMTKPADITWGDIAYSANMAYADYFGVSLKTEADCLKQAYADAVDPDGYPGKIFNRWLADIMGKNTKISWSEYI